MSRASGNYGSAFAKFPTLPARSFGVYDWRFGVSGIFLHRNPRFFEQPEQFWPDRFAAHYFKDFPGYAYLPFGAGSRSCIGNQFATMEAILILILIAQRYRLELVSGQAPIQAEPSVSLRMKKGLRMRVEASK